LGRRGATPNDPIGVDALVIVPSQASPPDSAPQLELRPVAEAGPEAPVAYVATTRAAEIVDVVFAVASIAWKPPRRASKPLDD
jgi:hypothetical protein